jgi:hypothetical protein
MGSLRLHKGGDRMWSGLLDEWKMETVQNKADNLVPITSIH